MARWIVALAVLASLARVSTASAAPSAPVLQRSIQGMRGPTRVVLREIELPERNPMSGASWRADPRIVVIVHEAVPRNIRAMLTAHRPGRIGTFNADLTRFARNRPLALLLSISVREHRGELAS